MRDGTVVTKEDLLELARVAEEQGQKCLCIWVNQQTWEKNHAQHPPGGDADNFIRAYQDKGGVISSAELGITDFLFLSVTRLKEDISYLESIFYSLRRGLVSGPMFFWPSWKEIAK